MFTGPANGLGAISLGLPKVLHVHVYDDMWIRKTLLTAHSCPYM